MPSMTHPVTALRAALSGAQCSDRVRHGGHGPSWHSVTACNRCHCEFVVESLGSSGHVCCRLLANRTVPGMAPGTRGTMAGMVVEELTLGVSTSVMMVAAVAEMAVMVVAVMGGEVTVVAAEARHGSETTPRGAFGPRTPPGHEANVPQFGDQESPTDADQPCRTDSITSRTDVPALLPRL